MGSEHAPKQSFGFALAIYIGMIEKVYAAFKRRIDKLDYSTFAHFRYSHTA